ncbi:hypothetical protein B0H12DRAFT_1135982 [Mycena haematopus]|nr:hypothetical protein B0H12DRAFT_1135982 [Mycena haematopus]
MYPTCAPRPHLVAGERPREVKVAVVDAGDVAAHRGEPRALAVAVTLLPLALGVLLVYAALSLVFSGSTGRMAGGRQKQVVWMQALMLPLQGVFVGQVWAGRRLAGGQRDERFGSSLVGHRGARALGRTLMKERR